MKHLGLLLVIALLAYSALYAVGAPGRTLIWGKVRQHLLPIIAILCAVFGGLVAMFYLNSINLL